MKDYFYFVLELIPLLEAHFKFAIEMKYLVGGRGSVVVKALCYRQEGRGFDNR
jgi:hypothetical protein